MEEKAWQRIRYDCCEFDEDSRKRFEEKFKFECGGKEIVMIQKPVIAHWCVGRMAWDASLVLSKYIEKRFSNSDSLKGKRVIELGAGCGAPGIVSSLLGADIVYFTDVYKMLGHLRENVRANLGDSGQNSFTYTIKELHWGRTPVSSKKFKPPFDIVLGADIIYSPRSVIPLLKTASRLMDHNSTFFLCFEVHESDSAELFWEKVEDYFDVFEVPFETLDEFYRHEEIEIFELTKKETT